MAPRQGSYPYNNYGWVYGGRGYRETYRKAAGTTQQRHRAAVREADRALNEDRLRRGDRRRADTDPTGIIVGDGDLGGTLRAGRGWTGRPLDIDDDTQADTDTGTGRGPAAGAIRQQTGGRGVVARLRRRRAGLAGTGAGAQAIERGAAAGGMTGPGAQARAMRRAERRGGMGAGGIAAQMPGFARVKQIGSALRARRAGLSERPDVEALADELAEAVEAGDIGAADIPEAAAESGSAGAELLAALAAAAADAPDDDLSDVLAGIAEAAAGRASACTCSTSAPQDNDMNLNANQLATIASMLQGSGLAGLVAPQQGRFDRFALEARPTSYRLARSPGVAPGATVNVTVNTNKDIAAGSAIYVAAIDPATGQQFFDFALSNVVIAGDNVYGGPAGATDGPDLNPDGQTAPGFAVFAKIPSGTTITYTLTNNNGVAVNFLASVRAQATRAVAGIDGTCSA